MGQTNQELNRKEVMNDKFDELAKGMAQSVTRRGALRKFGVGLAGMALACFGVANQAQADKRPCSTNADCPTGQQCFGGVCFRPCSTNADCPGRDICQGGFCTRKVHQGP